MSAREDILQRIRTATADVTEPDPALDVPVEWTYGQPLATADVLVMLVDHSQFKAIQGDAVQQQYVVDTKGVWR